MVLHIAVLCASLTACRIISEYADVSISACSKVGWTSGLEQLPDIQPSGVEQKCLPLGLIGVLPDIRPRQAEQECKLVWVQMCSKRSRVVRRQLTSYGRQWSNLRLFFEQ